MEKAKELLRRSESVLATAERGVRHFSFLTEGRDPAFEEMAEAWSAADLVEDEPWAANPVAYLIPSHRVLRAAGGLGGYRWGTDRKRAMLLWEHGRATAG